MANASIRYIVDDVDAAIAFYTNHLGFTEVMHPAPTFAMLTRDRLRLVLSAPGGGPGGGQAMPDGTEPQPGGWNRFAIEVEDLETVVARLRSADVRFRNTIVTGVGGRQVLVEDPSGNPVELFEPTRPEARLAAATGPDEQPHGYEVRPIGRVESVLVDLAAAPKQGDAGAPDAWLAMDPDVRPGLRDIAVGDELFVFTWLHRGRRDELTTHPQDDLSRPELGVFSTRSPSRPNPIGLHRVTVLEVGQDRIRVQPLEAVHGTPIVDLKPVLVTDIRLFDIVMP